MNMFKPKTASSVQDYISQIDEPRRGEIQKIHEFIQKTLPRLDVQIFHNIIGYGSYHYRSERSKSEGEWFTVGLASQKNYISIYVCSLDSTSNQYVAETHKDWFPKASIGKSCIRFKRFDDIDFANLKKILLLADKYGPINNV